MDFIQITNWQDYRRDGEQFLHTALRAHAGRKQAFNAEALYNLTCMAIEKLIMAFLMKNGDLAENHTMGDLLYALERHLGDVGELREDLLYLDGFQEICDLENYVVKEPTIQDLEKILSIGSRVYDFLKPKLGTDKLPTPAAMA